MASFYLHIPFCEHKCIYCDFYSIASQDSSLENSILMEHFLEALEIEIKLRAGMPQFHDPYETIFFGGGTPSLLSPAAVEKILNLLTMHFFIQPDAEITLEANPGTVNREKLKTFRSIGINRLSIGIQSFHDEDLKFLTRIHTAAEAQQSINDAFVAGFDNISVDLIFSLPFQTMERWRGNLEQAIVQSPMHISCYSLIIEPETPLFRMVQSKQVIPLETERDAELYEFTMEFLGLHGYTQYEVSNFGKPGFQCRHNLNYWNHTNYLGFGPSAHSFWKNERWWNVSNIAIYIEQLKKRCAPVAGSEHLTDRQLVDETIFLGLRSEGIDLDNYLKRFHRNFLTEFQQTISHFEQKGLARLEGNRWHLTSKGYLLCDEICQSFHSENKT